MTTWNAPFIVQDVHESEDGLGHEIYALAANQSDFSQNTAIWDIQQAELRLRVGQGMTSMPSVGDRLSVTGHFAMPPRDASSTSENSPIDVGSIDATSIGETGSISPDTPSDVLPKQGQHRKAGKGTAVPSPS